MAHQYSRVGFNSSVEVNEVNLSLSYGGVTMVNNCISVGVTWMPRVYQARPWTHKKHPKQVFLTLKFASLSNESNGIKPREYVFFS